MRTLKTLLREETRLVSRTYETCNYFLFKTHLLNRNNNASVESKVGKGLDRWPGWDKCRPLVCYFGKGGKLIVVDGQHRLEAARKRGLAVCFTITEEKDKRPNEYNIYHTGWKTMDYIDQYAGQGMETYKKLHRFMKKYQLCASSCMILVAGESGYPKLRMKELKEGFLEVNGIEWKRASDFALFLNNVRMTCPQAKITRKLIQVLIHVCQLDEFDKEWFVSRLKKCPELLFSRTLKDVLLREVENVYNKDRRVGKRLPIYQMVQELELKKRSRARRIDQKGKVRIRIA